MSGTSLGTLVERARDSTVPLQERHAAFALLVDETQHLAFGLALSALRDVEDARDAAQEAYTTAWLRLPQLRHPSAFTGWLRTIVTSQCTRRLRARRDEPGELPEEVEAPEDRRDFAALVRSALSALPTAERQVTILFYFLGHTLPEIARLLRLKPGTVGKRLHAARLRIRRTLPRSVREDFVALRPARAWSENVRLGLLDEYVGEYRFDERPEHIVSITRSGSVLVGASGGQRHELAPAGRESLVTRHFDGEGLFHRDRRGRVTHFVYYELGRRLGVARKMSPASLSRADGPAYPQAPRRGPSP